jgi:hypothetical protein
MVFWLGPVSRRGGIQLPSLLVPSLPISAHAGLLTTPFLLQPALVAFLLDRRQLLVGEGSQPAVELHAPRLLLPLVFLPPELVRLRSRLCLHSVRLLVGRSGGGALLRLQCQRSISPARHSLLPISLDRRHPGRQPLLFALLLQLDCYASALALLQLGW